MLVPVLGPISPTMKPTVGTSGLSNEQDGKPSLLFVGLEQFTLNTSTLMSLGSKLIFCYYLLY